jgi:hypothetical protein
MRHRERAVGAVELELAQSVAATEERSEDIPDVGALTSSTASRRTHLCECQPL